ncbi:MAG: Mu-like prophage major head subunit gpT family protein [Candidatus Omnitrophica bacterium]|jgi:phage major head subunit gpT-like protein|nr:Mu-like prophage major head subunit gpT family protein [Candidatus Omnitrophota bacterium]
MGALSLSERAIIGAYYFTLRATVPPWIEALSNYFPTDQEQEILRWLGSNPTFRQWVGPRVAKGISEHGVIIPNIEFEATLEFLRKEVTRDKTGQVMVRIREFAQRANQHWARLLTELIVAGEAAACYDGQLFFDTDHQEDNSPAQSNDLAVALSTEGENPSVAEFAAYVLQAITAMLGFVDGYGEPMNEGAQEFMVMVPTGLWPIAKKAIQASVIVDTTQAADNVLSQSSDLKIQLQINPRLDALGWYSVANSLAKFAVFRTDGIVKPFIRIEEGGVRTQALAEGSEYAFQNNRFQFGAAANRGKGYGYWQQAVLVTSTDKQ